MYTAVALRWMKCEVAQVDENPQKEQNMKSTPSVPGQKNASSVCLFETKVMK
jgi:hypothetical protein